ncbi:hypothetical protein Nepgr_029108 [Nepenthes gracilis]|uniref:Uncharacterized protein n=1 Tax=Nepenthes gracilis TaxID=150966 RepID=A0AAD3TCY9_NEPGR|nr:hypothetical protein Nepgr_029108 [Nepenthes gracilis]
MEGSSSDTEHTFLGSESGSHAPVSSGAHSLGEARSETTVAGPSQGRGVPPGFERVPPHRGALAIEAEWLRARVAHLEDALAESEARVVWLADANVGAQGRILALEEEKEQLGRRHQAEVAALRTEMRSMVRPEDTRPDLDRRYLDAIRLCKRLALLEDPGFRVGVIDSRNSSARTRDQLVDYPVQSSSSGHRDR